MPLNQETEPNLFSVNSNEKFRCITKILIMFGWIWMDVCNCSPANEAHHSEILSEQYTWNTQI